MTLPLTSRFLLLLLLIHLTIAPSRADELRADRSETRQRGSQTTRTYGGAVSAVFDSSSISADSAIVASDSNFYRFLKAARFEDDRYVVAADSIRYNRKAAIALLGGNVRLADGERSLSAGAVSYDAKSQWIRAHDDVAITLSTGVQIQANSWFQDAGADTSSGSGSVRLFTKDSVTVTSDRVFVSENGNGLLFTEAVSLNKGPWEAVADTVQYDQSADQISFTSRVALARRGVAQKPDSIAAFSDQAVMGLQSGAFSVMSLHDRVSFSVLDSARTLSAASSDSAWVKFEAEYIRELKLAGAVSIDVGSPDTGMSKLEGGSATIWFHSGQPSRIRIDGKGQMQHEAKTDSLSAEISGQGLEIQLTEGVLHSVVVDSQAVCELKGAHPTRLSGNHLDLRFDGQRLARAEVKGSVQGQYKVSGDGK